MHSTGVSRGRLFAVALVSLVALLAMPALAGARTFHIGINANTQGLGDPGEEMDLVGDTGTHQLREEIDWSRVEPANDEWEWAEYDELFELAAERKMRILPLLAAPPCWAVPELPNPEDECEITYPVSDAEYAEYVAHVVARYGRDGDFWEAHPKLDAALAPRYFEIWNEPYYPAFSNYEVDPERYASLYKAAVIAGREANPESRYLVESVPDATTYNAEHEASGFVHWAEAMVEAEPEIGKYIDGISVQPFPDGTEPDYEPENGTDAGFKNTDVNHERWLEEGIDRPVWITAFGYSSCDDGANRCVPGESQEDREQQKAEWLAQVFDELGESSYSYVDAIYLHNFREWKTPESEPNSNFGEWYGIFNLEEEHLPAWSSFADAVAAYDGTPFQIGINANTQGLGDPGEEMDLVGDTGAGNLREEIRWSEVEPSEGKWEWTDYDELFELAAERGMRILPLLLSPPCWAVRELPNPEDECEITYPESDGDFAYYVARVVERYGRDGDFWEAHPKLDAALAPRYFEIWNEPYYKEFSNYEVDPERYASLYKAAVIAGREANPASRYLVESVVDATTFDAEHEPNGFVHWAEAMVEAEPEIGKYIDGIAIHPYPDHQEPDYEPENGTDASFKNTDVNHERWLELGIDRPIWITEIGYSSCDDGANRCVPGESQEDREQQKAEWLAQVFAELGEARYSYVDAVYLYNFREWKTPESEPNGNFGEWFGIFNLEEEHLPAWNSFATAVTAYDDAP